MRSSLTAGHRLQENDRGRPVLRLAERSDPGAEHRLSVEELRWLTFPAESRTSFALPVDPEVDSRTARSGARTTSAGPATVNPSLPAR